jgi:hypothetical protein
MPDEYTSLPAWDSSTMPMNGMGDGLNQTYTVQQDFYPSTSGAESRFTRRYRSFVHLD